jgi:hypothetical protein
LDQASLKDRVSFLEDQKALYASWTANMAALIEGQNTALHQVVMQTVGLLRAQTPAALLPAPVYAPVGAVSAWAWIGARLLLGTAATVVVTLAAVIWV